MPGLAIERDAAIACCDDSREMMAARCDWLEASQPRPNEFQQLLARVLAPAPGSHEPDTPTPAAITVLIIP